MKRRTFLKAIGATVGAIALGVKLSVGEAVAPDVVSVPDPDDGVILIDPAARADDVFHRGEMVWMDKNGVLRPYRHLDLVDEVRELSIRSTEISGTIQEDGEVVIHVNRSRGNILDEKTGAMTLLGPGTLKGIVR